jgi:hypothetical protein
VIFIYVDTGPDKVHEVRDYAHILRIIRMVLTFIATIVFPIIVIGYQVASVSVKGNRHPAVRRLLAAAALSCFAATPVNSLAGSIPR